MYNFNISALKMSINIHNHDQLTCKRFIYMTTSFDPENASSSGHNTRTWNIYRN